MVDLTNVILVLITVFSAIFIAFTEGFKITFGYRSSEETRQRKERIDNKLRDELDRGIEHFLVSEECQGGGPDRINGIAHWGYRSVVAEDITAELLNRSDQKLKAAIKALIGGMIVLSLTVIIMLFQNISDPVTILILAVYFGATGFLFWVFITSADKALKLREAFVKLDENTTLEFANKVDDEMLQK